MLVKPTTDVRRLPPIDRASRHSLRYRDITQDDMGFLCALYRSTREAELARTPWDEVQKQAFIQMQFDAQHSHYQKHYPDALWLIIEQNTLPIGRLYLERWQKEHRIIDIALMPSARNTGIGGDILTDLMHDARREDKSVSIHVEKTNPALSLYYRLGFQTTEDKGVYDLLVWTPS
ncbi:GNAT family N-acetyltransferase [Coralliovum pocilloporae]|uniref:GNAT family N-acetyltransferase n=1 Tax=Coralliovum pocilloporae TaxID=3066369 RepID=UPI003306B0E9